MHHIYVLWFWSILILTMCGLTMKFHDCHHANLGYKHATLSSFLFCFLNSQNENGFFLLPYYYWSPYWLNMMRYWILHLLFLCMLTTYKCIWLALRPFIHLSWQVKAPIWRRDPKGTTNFIDYSSVPNKHVGREISQNCINV